MSLSASVSALAVGSLPCSPQGASSGLGARSVKASATRRERRSRRYPGEALIRSGWPLQWEGCEQGKLVWVCASVGAPAGVFTGPEPGLSVPPRFSSGQRAVAVWQRVGIEGRRALASAAGTRTLIFSIIRLNRTELEYTTRVLNPIRRTAQGAPAVEPLR